MPFCATVRSCGFIEQANYALDIWSAQQRRRDRGMWECNALQRFGRLRIVKIRYFLKELKATHTPNQRALAASLFTNLYY